MASTEEKAYEIMRELDVDYVLVIFGGMVGYSSDGIIDLKSSKRRTDFLKVKIKILKYIPIRYKQVLVDGQNRWLYRTGRSYQGIRLLHSAGRVQS